MTDLLYKYLPLNKYNSGRIESIFVKNQLWFSQPAEFNDPFDCAIDLTTEGTREEWFKHMHRKARDLAVCSGSPAKRLMRVKQFVDGKRYKVMTFDLAAKARSEVGVCCLSATRDNLLMWSHYGASHTGLVLEFKAGPHDRFFRRSQPVIYQKEYPQVSILDSSEARLNATLLTKSADWEYEAEYRIIGIEGGNRPYDFPPELLTGVIFGCRMSDEFKEMVKAWVTAHPAKPALYQAAQSKTSFSLEIIPA